MEDNHSSQEDFLIENHPFYQCIQPLIVLQKLAGGWIHRPPQTSGRNQRYYTFLVYCLFWELITISALVRTAFFFTKDVSMQTKDMFVYLQVAMYISIGVCQTMSAFKYKNTLSFWDGLLSLCPEKFTGKLTGTKAVIWMMVAFQASGITFLCAGVSYLISRPEPEPLLLMLAQPWSNSQAAKIVVLATMFSFLPACVSWFGANIQFLMAAYYLCSGFRRLQRAMQIDILLVTELVPYKAEHLHLSRLTDMLDDILRGYIGTNIAMSTFNLCLVIFTLNGSHDLIDMAAAITILFIALFNMSLIIVFSISINSWVSGEFTCEICIYR